MLGWGWQKDGVSQPRPPAAGLLYREGTAGRAGELAVGEAGGWAGSGAQSILDNWKDQLRTSQVSTKGELGDRLHPFCWRIKGR